MTIVLLTTLRDLLLDKGFAQNLLAGLVQMSVDVLLITLLLGRWLSRREEKRWKKPRRLLGERLYLLNEAVLSWWMGFRYEAHDEENYDGTVRTPSVFGEIDALAEQFAFVMNDRIAEHYGEYRLAVGRIASFYRRLCVEYGAKIAGGYTLENMDRFRFDIQDPEPISFRSVKDSFVGLLKALDYEPVDRCWWDPEEFKEARATGVDLIVIRQAEADMLLAILTHDAGLEASAEAVLSGKTRS